jgi:Dyp-type peroxidase family
MSDYEPTQENGVPAPATLVKESPEAAALPDKPVDELFVGKNLADVQGNILKGHGRPYVKCLFFRFKDGGAEKVRAWIGHLADEVITSAPRQLEETELYHNHGIPGGLFGAFFLSSAGYKYLDIALPVKRVEDPITGQRVSPFKDPATGELLPDAFSSGMKARQKLLNDPKQDEWESFFQSDIHAMLLLGDVDPGRLNEAAAREILGIKAATQAIHVEHGQVINNENGDGIEHFGYADGVSQPLFLQEDLKKVNENGQEKLSVWNPRAALGLVLVPDGNGTEPYSFGSFFVFRKLEQNVKGFKEMEEEMAEALRLQGHDAERAGALLVGRFEDGTPVTLQGAEGMHHPIPNGFTYQDDEAGLKCPFQAHIRKVNPRKEDQNRHRIARRGIPYGHRKPDFSDQPVKDVGLLFMCYQKHIEDQFEFMQVKWANNPNFDQKGVGLDPIVGQGTRTDQEYAFKWGKNEREKGKFNFGAFVTMRGGEYFFAPCLSFLRNLGNQ